MESIKCCIENCGQTLFCADSYRVHLNLIHILSDTKIFKCTFDECRKQFLSAKGLIEHLKRFHKFVNKIKSDNNQPINDRIMENSVIEQDCISVPETQSTVEISQVSESNNVEGDELEGNNDLQQHLEKIFLNFLVDLHANSNLTKDVINEIFKKIKNNILDPICSKIDVHHDTRIYVDSAYNNYNSQYKFERRLEENGYLINGDDQVISYKVGNVYKNGVSVLDEIKEKVCLMPLNVMFKKIFEIPNLLDSVLTNMRDLKQQEKINNLVNSKRWKNIEKNFPPDAIIVPFDLYTDDFETGNSLGSNAGTHKITAYYISFPTFPQHLQSCTEYIFEALLYPSRLKYDEFEYCLERLIEMFKELEDIGIVLDIDGEEKTVYFVLSRIIGDNLALNEILGFTTSFNAFKFCRMCTVSKDQSKKNMIPSSSDLRSFDQYELDKLKDDLHKTGIRHECLFNSLTNFHCTENIVCDIMHDLYEGIVKYDISMILRAFIEDKKLSGVNLDIINNIKQNFNYGRIEIGNLSMPIYDKHIKNCSLKMSASEMKTFLHFLPLMLGPLIPPDNKYWLLLLNLVDISDLVMSSYFDEILVEKLKLSIENYTSSYREIFGDTLKPKHHFLLHYIHCIEYNGPLRFMMTFAYETKNKVVKSYANVCCQRKNLAKSLCYKSAMRFNNFIRAHREGLKTISSHVKATAITWNDFSKNIYYNSLQIDHDHEIFICKKVCHKRTSYEIGYFIVDNVLNPLQLMKIIDILFYNREYFFIIENYVIEKYDAHLRSYKVGEFQSSFHMINIKEVVSLPFNLHKTSLGSLYFRPKHI